MSCRPILRDLQSRDHVICRICLSRLAKKPLQPCIAPLSTRATGRRKAPRRSSSDQRSGEQQEQQQKLTRAELARQLQRAKAEPSLPDINQGTANGDFSVRYFEQDDKRRRELADEQAFGESFGKLDASELESSLSDFKAGLETTDGKNAFQSVLAEVGEGWDEVKTVEDMERMIAKMDLYTKAMDKEIEETAADLPKEVLAELLGDVEEEEGGDDDINDVVPSTAKTATHPGFGNRRHTVPHIRVEDRKASQRTKIGKLNSAILSTYLQSQREPGLSKQHIKLVYGAYHAARRGLSQDWDRVPQNVWEYLWKALATEGPQNVNRLQHIALLSRDMTEAGVTLTPAQQLLTIEAVFVDGWEGKALESWRRCAGTLGADGAPTFQEFWELGARMYSRAGDAEQAERAVDKLLDRRMDPRILMTLIRTCCEQGTPEGREKAWATYRRMRGLLGEKMKLTDYDQVISYFLAENLVENGLYAFVDMMSNGRIDLTRQRQLPSVIANKFFFGKWLKRLIGAGNLDGAHKVVEFMEQKGVEGASIQVNGLIGAWLRTGGDRDAAKADALAWRMIATRIQFVKDRKTAPHSRPPVLGLPRATPETFYVLAEKYQQRELHAKLEDLWTAFREAELRSDAFMMNQLLESLVSQGQWARATALYRSLVHGMGVTPDPFTFSALWKTLDINRLHVVPPERLPEAASQARAMVREMVEHRAGVPAEGLDGQLARKILHSFRRLGDLAGLVVALTTLRELFNFLPAEMLVLEMVLGTTKISWDTPSSRRKLMLAKRNLDFALADGVEGEERATALYEYLKRRYMAELKDKAKDHTKPLLESVAKEMGVHQ